MLTTFNDYFLIVIDQDPIGDIDAPKHYPPFIVRHILWYIRDRSVNVVTSTKLFPRLGYICSSSVEFHVLSASRSITGDGLDDSVPSIIERPGCKSIRKRLYPTSITSGTIPSFEY